ncbi:MAG: hypothetical protein WCG12_20520 [Alcaligenaceae bacterium]
MKARKGFGWLANLYVKRVEAPFFARRLKKRLPFYQLQSPEQLPVMTINCCVSLSDDVDHSSCTDLMSSHGGFFSRLYGTTTAIEQNRVPQTQPQSQPQPQPQPNRSTFTMHGIALDQYKDFQQYKKALGKRSSFFLRHANKAAKAGYKVLEFSAANHSVDMVAIRRSMKVRSFGVMPDAWLANVKQFGGLPEQWSPTAATPCMQHWERLFGVFIDQPGHKQGGLLVDQQLVGYAILHRVGNMLTYRDFIGDGRFLGDGVMKLLHLHLMQWVLDSGNIEVVGVENFTYGSVERGSQGMFFWKKKALFAPYRVDIIQAALPDDFDGRQYLELNPDVAAAGDDPAQHYQVHGRFEKRAYRRG